MTTGAVTALGLLVTAVVVASPNLYFAYRSPAGHLVLETAAAMVGGLVALLLYGRFRRTMSVQELLLAYALVILAVAALFFVTIPDVLGADPGSAVTTWAPLALRVVGGLLLLSAALMPGRYVRGHRRRGDAAALVSLMALALLLGVLGDARLPEAVVLQPLPEASARPVLEGHPLVLAAQVVLFVCFAGAALLFTVQAERTPHDPLLRWLAAGAALGACARVNYLLFPSLYSEWLYTGDLLRLGFYLMLLVGAVSEIVKYWSAQVATAATLERERLARDLHDGAVQELGYIWSQSLVMTRRPDAATAQRVHAAAERALDETRRVVDALNASPDEPLADSLRRAAADVANRYAAVLKLDLDESVHVDGDHREALVRIVREAVGNAARHASATVIEVVMTPGVVRVRDDGRGFDPAAGGRPGGHGLASMRDRAEGAGGRFRIESAAGRGTTVEVTW